MHAESDMKNAMTTAEHGKRVVSLIRATHASAIKYACCAYVGEYYNDVCGAGMANILNDIWNVFVN